MTASFYLGELVCVQAGVVIKPINDRDDDVWLKTNELGMLMHESRETVKFDGAETNVVVVLIPTFGMFFVPKAHLVKSDDVKAMKDFIRFKEW